MCSVVAGLGVGMQLAGDYLGQKSQASSYQQMMEAQAKGAWRDYNFAYQNYELERNDAYDAAVAEITKTRLNALQLNSQVKAAVYENMGDSRTARMLVRNVEGDTARTVATMQDNYTRKSNEIDLNEGTSLKTLQSTLENINASAPKMPSRLTNFISSAAVGLNAYTSQMNQKNAIEASGGKYNFVTGGRK